MVIDELVILLKAEGMGPTVAAFKKVERGIHDIGDVAGDMAETMQKDLGAVDRMAAIVSGSFKTLGIAAAIAGAGMSAVAGISLHAAADANELRKSSDALGVNAEELSVWEAAVASAGLSADAFRNDLRKLKDQRGTVSLEDLLPIADELAKLPSLAEAVNRGNKWGIGEDMTAFLYQGGRGAEGVMEAVEKSRSSGHGTSDRHSKELQQLRKDYLGLEKTIGGVATRIGGEFAPGLSRALVAIADALTENKEKIDNWVSGVAGSFESFLDGIMGTLDKAEDRLSMFNGQLSQDNVASPDPVVRGREIAEREQAFLAEASGIGVRTAVKAIPVIGAEKPSDMAKAVENGFRDLEKAGQTLHEAAQTDWRMRMGDKAADTGNPLKNWFADYRTHHDLPGDKLSSQAGSTPDYGEVLPVMPTYAIGKPHRALSDSEMAFQEKYGLKVRPDGYYSEPAEQTRMPGPPIPSTLADSVEPGAINSLLDALAARPVADVTEGRTVGGSVATHDNDPPPSQEINVTNHFTINQASNPVAVADEVMNQMGTSIRPGGFQPAIM